MLGWWRGRAFFFQKEILLRKKTERIYIYLFLNMESSNLINKNCLSCSCIEVEIRTDLFVY